MSSSGSTKTFFAVAWYRSARKFLKEAMHELREVVWPSAEEVKQYTILVITVLIGVAVWIAIWEGLFQWIADRVLDLYGTHGRTLIG